MNTHKYLANSFRQASVTVFLRAKRHTLLLQSLAPSLLWLYPYTGFGSEAPNNSIQSRPQAGVADFQRYPSMHVSMIFHRTIALTYLLLFCPIVSAINCDRAKTAPEVAICSNPELKAFDDYSLNHIK